MPKETKLCPDGFNAMSSYWSEDMSELDVFKSLMETLKYQADELVEYLGSIEDPKNPDDLPMAAIDICIELNKRLHYMQHDTVVLQHDLNLDLVR